MSKKITVFAIVLNSMCETEILAYTVKMSKKDIKKGKHFVKIENKVENHGYEILATFDQSEPAGKVLFGTEPLYGDKERYLSDIVKSTNKK